VTDLLVAGGTVVTPAGSRRADVAVAGGRIEDVGADVGAAADRVLDATGLLVLPGAIDVHTHLRLPVPERPDRFRMDTHAAARGGTTTVLSFNNPGTGISHAGAASLLGGLDEFRRRSDGQSAVDYGLSAVVGSHQDDPLAEIPALIEAGVPTFKAFMVYDFALGADQIERVMALAARHGGMLQLHCEDPAVIDPLVAAALASGAVGPRHHAHTRPPEAEAAATRRAIEMARRARASLYVVHLSCAAALDAVAEAKSRGEPVYAETCPHYLVHTDAAYDDPDDAEVIKRVISPPLRARSDVAALWHGLRDGVLDVVASDHVPDRVDTEKRMPAPPFPEISNGGPGIETLLSIVYSEGVAAGRIGLERMVEVLAANPARLFGLSAKGVIEPGRDADLVLWDPAARRTIRQRDLHHSSDFTPFEGLGVVGTVRAVLLRGREVGDGDEAGRFIERHLA
jgi:dihydropyrimidinase